MQTDGADVEVPDRGLQTYEPEDALNAALDALQNEMREMESSFAVSLHAQPACSHCCTRRTGGDVMSWLVHWWSLRVCQGWTGRRTHGVQSRPCSGCRQNGLYGLGTSVRMTPMLSTRPSPDPVLISSAS